MLRESRNCSSKLRIPSSPSPAQPACGPFMIDLCLIPVPGSEADSFSPSPPPLFRQPEDVGVAVLFVGQMISNTPLNEIRSRVHSSHSLRDLVPETSAIEAPDLATLIAQGQVAALVRYPADNPGDTARVCLDMAKAHPHEVTVLLWKEAVAREAMDLLRHAEETSVPEDASEALARALLSAGHGLAVNSQQWPTSVRDLLQKRKKANADYWASKLKKFEDDPLKNGFPCFKARGAPFLSRSEQKSALNQNMKLGEKGKKFSCAQLAEAIQDDPKAFLKRISQRDVSFLDHAALDRRYLEARHHGGSTSVQFTSENFGKLLARVASRVRPGERCSFGVVYAQIDIDTCWPYEKYLARADKWFVSGHSMRVFLERASESRFDEDSMGLKVSLYEPNVTGDMTHLRVLPEHLKRLSFRQFATVEMSQFDALELSDSVDVLGLDIGDRALAQALAGQFVPHGVKAQVSSFLQALARGNLHEMRAAVSVLLAMGEAAHQQLNARSKELGFAVLMALIENFAEVLLELAHSPLLKVLEPTTLTEMVSVQRIGFPFATQCRAVAAIEALGELFAQVEDSVDAHTVRAVILSETVMSRLNRELQEDKRGLVEAYGGLLGRLKGKPGATMFKGVFALENLRWIPGKALAAWDRVLQAFKPVLTHATILQLLKTLDGPNVPGPSREAFLRVFLDHLPRLGLSPHSLVSLLDPVNGLLSLRHAIERKHKDALRAYAQLVIAGQASPSKLGPYPARQLLLDIRSTYTERLWYFPCVRDYTDDYKRTIQPNEALHALFQSAESVLKG